MKNCTKLRWTLNLLMLWTSGAGWALEAGNGFGNGGGDVSEQAIFADLVRRGSDTIAEFKYIFELLPASFQERKERFAEVFSKDVQEMYHLQQGSLYGEDIENVCQGLPLDDPKRAWQRVDAVSCGEKIATYVSRDSWADLTVFTGSSMRDLIPRFPDASAFVYRKMTGETVDGKTEYEEKIRACRQTRLLVHEINVLAGVEASGELAQTDAFVLPLMGGCRRRSMVNLVQDFLSAFYEFEGILRTGPSRITRDAMRESIRGLSHTTHYRRLMHDLPNRDYLPLHQMMCTTNFLKQKAGVFVYKVFVNGMSSEEPRDLRPIIERHLVCAKSQGDSNPSLSFETAYEDAANVSKPYVVVNNTYADAYESPAPNTRIYDLIEGYWPMSMHFVTAMTNSNGLNLRQSGVHVGNVFLAPNAQYDAVSVWDYFIVFPETLNR